MLFHYLCQALARSAEMGKVTVGFVYENCITGEVYYSSTLLLVFSVGLVFFFSVTVIRT